MSLEETNPRLEAIIQEIKSRQTTQYEGYVPRADELLVAEIERLRARLALVDRLAEELEWYRDQVKLCRLIHSGGDTGRQALSSDGGKRASDALTAYRNAEQKGK